MKSKSFAVLCIGASLLALLGTVSGVAASPLPRSPKGTSDITAVAAGTQRLTIPAAAFTSFYAGYDYENHGRYLKHLHSPGGGVDNGWYLAPVHLPHGAVVTKMTFYYRDQVSVGQDVIARLQRAHFDQDDYQEMATVQSEYAAGSGDGSKSDTSIQYATIDDVNYGYWVVWDLPVSGASEILGCGIVIEYTPPATVTGQLSVPAAAFKPREDGYDYKNGAHYLEHYHGPGGGDTAGQYLAAIYLPHGATVTKMTFHWYNSTAALQGDARLMRTLLGTGNDLEMAHAASFGAGGYGSSYDDTIESAIIDNIGNVYYVAWHLPAPLSGDMSKGCGVLIEYDLPAATTSTGYISVPAAAFAPLVDGWDYNIDGCLEHFGGATRGHYEAAAYLPQGAKVSKVTFHYYDESADEGGFANLVRFDLTNADVYPYMTTLASAGSLGWGAVSSTTIDSPIVDNAQHGYWAYLDLPDLSAGHIAGCGLVIEYGYRAYLPSVLRNH